MARKQSQTVAPAAFMADLGAVDTALHAIAASEADARRLKNDLDGCVAALKADYQARIDSVLTVAAEARGLVQQFADAHPELFAPVRHQDLPHGRIGYRIVTFIRFLKSPDLVVTALESRRLFDAVIVRKSPNKDVLAAFDDETLAAVGARKATKDRFYIEIKQ